MLIIKFVFTIIILVAKIIFTKEPLIIFKNIVIILIVKFVLAKVLFVINIIKVN